MSSFFELHQIGLAAAAQVELPIRYDGVQVDAGYRIDILVEDQIILELKSVDRIQPIHKAQILSYLKLSQQRIGLLLNFNVIHLKDGITRVANN